MNNRNR